MAIAIPMLGLCYMHAVEMLPRVRYRKVGGIRFLRIGRWSLTASRTKGGAR